MITRSGMFGLTLAGVLACAAFAIVPSTASAGDRQVPVAPAIYRVPDNGAQGAPVQLVRRFYYGYGPAWGYGYGYYAPVRPAIVVPPPVVNYGYPAYGYGYAPYTYGYGYGYPPPAAGYGYYGPRVAVGVGVW
jgi:hypothetical protein